MWLGMRLCILVPVLLWWSLVSWNQFEQAEPRLISTVVTAALACFLLSERRRRAFIWAGLFGLGCPAFPWLLLPALATFVFGVFSLNAEFGLCPRHLQRALLEALLAASLTLLALVQPMFLIFGLPVGLLAGLRALNVWLDLASLAGRRRLPSSAPEPGFTRCRR